MCIEEFIMKYKAVVFDMDGVIFDSEQLVLKGWQELAAEKGIPDIEKPYYQGIGSNAQAVRENFLRFYGSAFPYDEYKAEMSRRFHERYDNGRLPLKPGVRELLGYLKEQGYAIGLASSTRSAVVTAEIRDAGLLPFFQHLTCGDMVTRSKPEPDIFLKACENLGVCPENTICIEDSYNGIRAASRAGMTPVMVPDMVPANEEMEQLAAHIFKDLLEVKEWISSLK